MGRSLGSRNKNKGESVRAENDGLTRAAGKNIVLSLIRASNETRARMQSEAGELGQEIKAAVEDNHVHAGALKLIAKFVRMNELKRVEFLGAFDLYRTYAREARLFGAEHAGDLVRDTEADAAEENVRRLRDAVRQAASG